MQAAFYGTSPNLVGMVQFTICCCLASLQDPSSIPRPLAVNQRPHGRFEPKMTLRNGLVLVMMHLNTQNEQWLCKLCYKARPHACNILLDPCWFTHIVTHAQTQACTFCSHWDVTTWTGTNLMGEALEMHHLCMSGPRCHSRLALCKLRLILPALSAKWKRQGCCHIGETMTGADDRPDISPFSFDD